MLIGVLDFLPYPVSHMIQSNFTVANTDYESYAVVYRSFGLIHYSIATEETEESCTNYAQIWSRTPALTEKFIQKVDAFVKVWIFFFVRKVSAFVSNRLHTFQHFFLFGQVKSIIDEHPMDSLLYNLDDSRNKTGCFFSSTNIEFWRRYRFRRSNWLSCMRCSFIYRFSKVAYWYILVLVVKWKEYDDVFIIKFEINQINFFYINESPRREDKMKWNLIKPLISHIFPLLNSHSASKSNCEHDKIREKEV